MTANLKIIRLLNGEELIAELLEEDDNTIQIKNTVRIVIVPSRTDPNNPSVGLAPWAEFAENKTFDLNKNAIITLMNPIKQFVSEYNRIHSGIVTPTSNLTLP